MTLDWSMTVLAKYNKQLEQKRKESGQYYHIGESEQGAIK